MYIRSTIPTPGALKTSQVDIRTPFVPDGSALESFVFRVWESVRSRREQTDVCRRTSSRKSALTMAALRPIAPAVNVGNE